MHSVPSKPFADVQGNHLTFIVQRLACFLVPTPMQRFFTAKKDKHPGSIADGKSTEEDYRLFRVKIYFEVVSFMERPASIMNHYGQCPHRRALKMV